MMNCRGIRSMSKPAQEEEGTPETEVAGHKRKKRGRKPLDPALPRVEVRHELPESERVCPLDGQTLVEIGVEVSEQLDIVPQQVRVIQHQRVKYACPPEKFHAPHRIDRASQPRQHHPCIWAPQHCGSRPYVGSAAVNAARPYTACSRPHGAWSHRSSQ